VSAGLVQAVVHALEDHGPLPLGQLAGMLGQPVAQVRAELAAFNDVDTSDLLLDPMFTITPAGGWPEDDRIPDPAPADTDVVAFSPAVAGPDVGLAHVDAGTLGPLLAAADQLSTLEPGNLALAAAVDSLRTALLAGVTGHAAYRTRTAAVFQHAATTQRAVRITYASAWIPKVTTRTIHPYRVVSTRRGYEIDAGPLDDQGKPRTFLITGIRDYRLLDHTFDLPPEAAEAVAANRTLSAVSGIAPHRSMWAVRHWAERVDQSHADADDVAFTAWLLPPVAERVALIGLAGGPGIDIDDDTLAQAPPRWPPNCCATTGCEPCESPSSVGGTHPPVSPGSPAGGVVSAPVPVGQDGAGGDVAAWPSDVDPAHRAAHHPRIPDHRDSSASPTTFRRPDPGAGVPAARSNGPAPPAADPDGTAPAARP
jgi:hypothetical protein